MAKVAARGPLPSSTSFHYSGNGASKVTNEMKRKTPSELREEQLKRKHVMEPAEESPTTVLNSMRNTNEALCGVKKPNSSKNPRYLDTRLDGIFPVRKSSVKLLLSRKGIAKEEFPVENICRPKESSISSDLADKSEPSNSCLEGSLAPTGVIRDDISQCHSAIDKCSGITFRTVKELSLSGEKFTGLSAVDMDKALKGLIAHEPLTGSTSLGESSERIDGSTSGKFCSQFHIPGLQTPLDFTLKTTMRVVSSSSVNRFHRLISSGTSNGMTQVTSWMGYSGDQNLTCSSGLASTNRVSSPKALYSWVYPQSTLPQSVISALTLSSVEGGPADFLSKRHLAWEDSFRSLYYMLRKNVCKLFYVCTSQFVAMFINNSGSVETKLACNAYVSQSTRGLRSLLKENDVGFSMPLCRSKVEQVSVEDMVELSEIEKHNLGQTRHMGSMSGVDNNPQSLLAFNGNKNVHALYDFLLNYRFFLTSLTGVDVPALYSPVPFENAALSAPEVRCKEVRRVDHVLVQQKEPSMKDGRNKGSSSSLCYSIEIKDAYLPPWIVSNVCDAMGSEGTNFEASFVTETASIGLNAGLSAICQKPDPETATDEEKYTCSSSSCVPNTIVSPHLCSGYLKSLKFCDSSYTASLSPV